MADDRVRRRVAAEAARLILGREESEVFRARMRAARRILRGDVPPWDLPTSREIRHQLEKLAYAHERQRQREDLCRLRLEALRLMSVLRAFQPRLIGGVLTGQVDPRSAIDLHVFSDNIADVTVALDRQAVAFDIARQRPRGKDRGRLIAEIHVANRVASRLMIYPADLAQRALKSAATGRVIQRAGIADLEDLIAREHPQTPCGPALTEGARRWDRFQYYQSLLLPLEQVKQDPQTHPEGDVLYHSLQVFELARGGLPYDEEFLLAALLHDVGKAIDLKEHTAAGLEALDGFITPRTAWLIEHHVEALALREGTLGVRSRRRLHSSEDFEELMLLAECDIAGRAIGAAVPDVEDALVYLRELAEMCGE